MGTPGEVTSSLYLNLVKLWTSLNNIITSLPIPEILVTIVPGFLGVTGLTRGVFVGGNYDVNDFPQPLTAPDLSVENWQIDCNWNTLLLAVDDGLFGAGKRIPLSLSVVIKRISPSSDTKICWGNADDVAAIDVQGPKGRHDLLDTYVETVLFPALKKFGDVTVHLGKRLKSSS